MTAGPLVSFVLINYNYGDYVGAALESVLAQTYADFECIVIDNASTDQSRDVLRSFADRADDRLRFVFHDRNLNQMGAFLAVLDELRGDYLTIVDADDMLFPDYAATHVQAHEIIRGGVAFTSSCVIEVDAADNVLTGGYDPFMGAIRKEPPEYLLNEALKILPDHSLDRLRRNIRLVRPESSTWGWSPGTANMHRMSWIRATRPRREKPLQVAATDNYFMWVNSAIAGSAQILMPLSAYRHHGRNRYAAMPSIPGMRIGTRAGVHRSAARRRHITFELTSRPREFRELSKGRFWELMDVPATVDGPAAKYYADPKVLAIIAGNYGELRAAFPDEELERELGARIGRKALRRIAR